MEFARLWHALLGEPPVDEADREAWMKAIADAPSTLQGAEAMTPGVLELVDRLKNDFSELQATEDTFALDQRFLGTMSWWDSVNRQSYVAQALGSSEQLRSQNDRLFLLLDELANDPKYAEAWETLLAHVRKRVLLDEFNMDPQLMYEFTRDLGPIDWRHPQAHALYWARKGTLMAEHRMRPDDIYNLINNDRMQIQALQGLARSGRIHFDPFAQSIPGRFPEPRFIETIDGMFDDLYTKYYDARGAGGETFIVFITNFLSSSIREWYRQGEIEKAQALMDRLDSLFGRGESPEQSVQHAARHLRGQRDRGEYDRQPHGTQRRVRRGAYGFRVGVGQGGLMCKEAIKFADEVTNYYKSHETVDYTTKLGVGGCATSSGNSSRCRSRFCS